MPKYKRQREQGEITRFYSSCLSLPSLLVFVSADPKLFRQTHTLLHILILSTADFSLTFHFSSDFNSFYLKTCFFYRQVLHLKCWLGSFFAFTYHLFISPILSAFFYRKQYTKSYKLYPTRSINTQHSREHSTVPSVQLI